MGTFYGETILKNQLVEGQQGSIRKKVKINLLVKPELDLSGLASYENSIDSLRKSEKVVDVW